PETAAEPEAPPLVTVGSGARRRRRRRGRGQGGLQLSPGGEPRQIDTRDGSRHPGAVVAQHGGRPGGARRRPGVSRPHPETPHTTAPHDELVSVVRGLVEASPKRSVSIDAVANALKARGFQRPPGSPRLVTRLRRIRELLVSPSGTITLAEDGAPVRSDTRPESAPMIENGPTRLEDRSRPPGGLDGEFDNDRQPDFLNYSEREPDLPEVDGNRADPLPAQQQPGRTGRRRRRRRWRGGPRQPAPGPQLG